MDVYVFKTSVDNADEVSKLKPLLTSQPAIADWNFDLEDCDNILRVVGDVYPGSIEALLQSAGYNCQELDY
jgi:hypothetical protein